MANHDSLTPEQVEQLKALGTASRHHPLWAFARFAVCMGIVVSLQLAYSTKFDWNEIVVDIGLASGLIGNERLPFLRR